MVRTLMNDVSKNLQLFDVAPPQWELDDVGLQRVARLVFPAGPEGVFDYEIPAELESQVEAGRRVKAPFGHGDRVLVGYCVEVAARPTSERKLKRVHSVIDGRSLLSAGMLELTEWISEHYLCNWGTVLEAVIPASVKGQAGTRSIAMLFVSPEVRAKMPELKLPRKQQHVLSCLAESAAPMPAAELALVARCTQAPINELRKKGLIERRMERTAPRDLYEKLPPREENYELNHDQQAGLDAILEVLNSREHGTVLLHGITGSGKTEVYMRAMQEAIRFGRQAIVLVPEISLTPQTRRRFMARFGHIAVLHSHLTDAERHWQWERIARGEVSVVVGARSAVFAPTPRLGLIILDEEHETSFKQETAPRYHARDVALRRAKQEGVPLILGSATPSLESWRRAEEGTYRLVSLPKRIEDRPLPDVLPIDLRNEDRKRTSLGAISRPLAMAMESALSDGGQVILLLNRRGFATHIQCTACGAVVRCPHCDIALTHHRTEAIALCHYCDYEIPAPMECLECHTPGLRYGGLGTQRLEAEVRARFPNFRCLRMDTDTMQGPGSHERALDSFRSGEVQILLGTQMIAKGLDFPNVTLVGVVNSDTALHLPDFRAAERTFQLLVQVAGRTGRGAKGGRVMIQTFSPDHPAIRAAARHDYQTFARQELPLRETLGYPPFGTMARLVFRGPIETVTREFIGETGRRLEDSLRKHAPSARLLGPAPAPIAKLRDKYRFQMQVQGPDGDAVRRAIEEATHGLKNPPDVQWIVDIDPLETL